MNSIMVYKLMRLRKDGTLGSLFINRKAVIPLNKWLEAEDHPTKGYAHRFGWHCTIKPVAPHLSLKGRVWAKCVVRDYQVYKRPKCQGGKWILANKIMIIEIISPRG